MAEMRHLREILEGYCNPKERKYAVHPIGQTGLTPRVFTLNYYAAAIESLIAAKVWRLGRRHFYNVYSPFVHSFRQCWAVEFLRISDKPKTGGRKNLTIALLHQRFQNDGAVPLATRQGEQKLFAKYDAECMAHSVYDKVRCQEVFHLDLDTQLRKPRPRGANLFTMTKLVLEWYVFVATYVTGDEPRYVTQGSVRLAQETAEQFYQLMRARMRCWKLDGQKPDTFKSRR